VIDNYRLFVHPLVLGTGKRLFRETTRPLPMRLVSYEAAGS
jgi:dihydrofolate reductase